MTILHRNGRLKSVSFQPALLTGNVDHTHTHAAYTRVIEDAKEFQRPTCLRVNCSRWLWHQHLEFIMIATLSAWHCVHTVPVLKLQGELVELRLRGVRASLKHFSDPNKCRTSNSVCWWQWARRRGWTAGGRACAGCMRRLSNRERFTTHKNRCCPLVRYATSLKSRLEEEKSEVKECPYTTMEKWVLGCGCATFFLSCFSHQVPVPTHTHTQQKNTRILCGHEKCPRTISLKPTIKYECRIIITMFSKT